MKQCTSTTFDFSECPHCGERADTWLDRSIWVGPDGLEEEYESFATRCVKCGKNVDAPKDYYEKH